MPRRQRPAGSETWICVASRCCCRAAYLCSPASSLYAARNTWKVRNVRTLCLITIHSCSHFTSAQKTRRIARISRTRRDEGGDASTRETSEPSRIFVFARTAPALTFIFMHILSVRTFRCVRISIPWHPSQTRARELGCLLGARSFYRKVEILVTILFRDLTRESRPSLSGTLSFFVMRQKNKL